MSSIDIAMNFQLENVYDALENVHSQLDRLGIIINTSRSYHPYNYSNPLIRPIPRYRSPYNFELPEEPPINLSANTRIPSTPASNWARVPYSTDTRPNERLPTRVPSSVPSRVPLRTPAELNSQ